MKYSILTSLFCFLALTTKAQDNFGRYYSAGEIQSKVEVKYGRMEFKMYSSDISGTTSTFFMWKNGGQTKDQRWNELDVETFGKSPNSWQSNPIWEYESKDTDIKRWEAVHDAIPVAKTWVIFAIEWTPNYIAWFNNGIEVRRILKGQDVPANHFRYKNGNSDDPVSFIADPMRMCFNHWATFPGEWLGPFDATKLPSFQFVDWLTYQAWNGTGFDPISIRHDFNSLEEVTTNYTISEHTFSENQCSFKPKNVGVLNGLLWLSITPYDKSRPPVGNEIPLSTDK